MTYETNDGYEPSSLEEDIFISDIPIDLTKENIKYQFQNPMDNDIDYITTFIDSYDFSMENCGDPDEKKRLIELRDDFFSFVRTLFKEYLDVGFPDFEDHDMETQNDLILCAYRYFVINIKRNFVHLVLNYIDKRKNSVLELCDKKKDVTTLAYKKEIQDPDDLLIISNINEIVRFIINSEFDVGEFLSLARKKNDYEAEYVDDAYDNVHITGNFTSKYRSMFDDEYLVSIVNKIRQKILKRNK